MPADLVRFIGVLYAIVVGFAFGEIVKSPAFRNLIAGRAKVRELVSSYMLVVAVMMFVISDYTVYMWAANGGGAAGLAAGSVYRGTAGSVLFVLDIALVSVIYLLMTVACLETTPRRLNTVLVIFVIWHLMVTCWWMLDGVRSGGGVLFSMPRPHILRSLVYFTLFLIYRVLIKTNVGRLGTAYANDDSTIVSQNVLLSCNAILCITIGTLSFIRFSAFHQLIYAAK